MKAHRKFLSSGLSGKDGRHRNRALAVTSGQALVEWTSIEYICTEDDGHVIVSATRKDMRGAVTNSVERENLIDMRMEVAFETRNVNLHPDSYIPQRGRIVFEPGDTVKEISIKVTKSWRVSGDPPFSPFLRHPQFLNNPRWNVEALVDVELSLVPNSGQKVFLGDPSICRIVSFKSPCLLPFLA
jgi:hypothetical protein